MNHEQLERDRGFLNYLSRTYRSMCPYLKEIHQTIDSWRTVRDKDGLKLERGEMIIYLASEEGKIVISIDVVQVFFFTFCEILNFD